MSSEVVWCLHQQCSSFMTRVLTVFDLIWFLWTLCGNLVLAMARSRHSTLAVLLIACIAAVALSFFLSYRCIKISKLWNPYILDDLSYQSKDLYNKMSDSNLQTALLPHMPAVTVHYMWCLKSHFEYKHYLSLLSVAKVLNPDQIVFHYLEMPQADQRGYFTWFDDIQREVAMISLKQIKNPKHCSHDFSRGVEISDDFPNNDGIYMFEDVAVSNLSREAFYQLTGAQGLVKSHCEDEAKGMCETVRTRAAQLFLLPVSEPYTLVPGQGRAILECPTIEGFNKASQSHCVQLSQRLFPSDIWRQNKTFDRFVRKVAFNSPQPVSPVPSPKLAAPKIAHILKFDEEKLSPLCFASIKSAFIHGELQHVFVHGHVSRDTKDPLWMEVAGQHSVTHIPTPSLGPSSSTRKQLLYGLQVLLQYGGLLLTCDTIIQKPVDPLLHYPTVSTIHKSIYRIIHHHVDFSVMAARPSSEFLQTLIPVLKQLTEIESDRNFDAVAYHIVEQYPASVHMGSDLVGHMTCQVNKCMPGEGQIGVPQSYTVKFAWKEGSPPSSVTELSQLITPLQSLAPLLSGPARNS